MDSEHFYFMLPHPFTCTYYSRPFGLIQLAQDLITASCQVASVSLAFCISISKWPITQAHRHTLCLSKTAILANELEVKIRLLHT